MRKFENFGISPKLNAQRNLMGITHYVDPNTLQFHKSRIVAFNVHDGGLLCSIIESVALDPENRSRGFRYVVFDIAGNVVDRPNLDDTSKTSNAARKSLYAFLNSIDAKQITKTAIERYRKQANDESNRLLADLLGE